MLDDINCDLLLRKIVKDLAHNVSMEATLTKVMNDNTLARVTLPVALASDNPDHARARAEMWCKLIERREGEVARTEEAVKRMEEHFAFTVVGSRFFFKYSSGGAQRDRSGIQGLGLLITEGN